MTVIKSDFFLALNQVATERGISLDDVLFSMREAILAAYHKEYGTTEEPEEGVEVKINQESGEMHIYKNDQDITPPGFGRIAAQTARQVVLQSIREAEKRTIVKHYSGQVGAIAKGRVIRFEGRNVLLDLGKAEGFLPVEEQIRSERYHLNDTLTVYIKEIKEDAYGNSRIVISRIDPELVKQLFMKEVPEIENGTVKVHVVIREPGERTKIAVHSDQTGVDPVGACVGQKGIRVKAVTDELGGAEKIDIIQYNPDDALFIREALSPAKVLSVKIDKKRRLATVEVDEDQAPLAIGQKGVNVNLAGRLTDYTIDIKQIMPEGSDAKKEPPAKPLTSTEPSEEQPKEVSAKEEEPTQTTEESAEEAPKEKSSDEILPTPPTDSMNDKSEMASS
ncbi:transcription termination factor NusA [Candidatus Roizmanbacteria bacterium RIFCSPLOWO2_01_FULL_42_14]|uniref:Transcription termination/antitermination protein NusA n=4 Tax=Candidatus Roizmaniibacteriota TaxID=1752723 RepID=A0A1F7K036_9BACT|nr:MAG: transcription termination factor NusA [Candidatus Roizmanbacteria bacterium RIFCSPHIGHO2_02_FULL_43_11]OGK37763.1 MAG: transcription termination factor NusA [Candidatus Roizmanbacteria bacterium RIFCSPHIGHO2_12_FULL_42_10]OGK51370.1 MAG: transcription termination factor NusA [Candidatus Roizmanbacteria bacterium RIFCSPLOWO2_01_FULL_42_14]OGK61213.1 MAG: transcription termination factor NusA [Candidatus Roizmanbacteria bacterium RIFCSPLOWO2_02_FULL_43_10]